MQGSLTVWTRDRTLIYEPRARDPQRERSSRERVHLLGGLLHSDHVVSVTREAEKVRSFPSFRNAPVSVIYTPYDIIYYNFRTFFKNIITLLIYI